MPSPAFHSALKAFGGWSGLSAFYFVGLAFPLCYATQTFRAHDKAQIRRQSDELRKASFAIFLSAILCFSYPSELYLQRHIDSDRHLHARVLDLVAAVFVTYVLAPLLGFTRLRRTAKWDRDGLAIDVPDPTPDWWHAEGRRLVTKAQAQCFTESTWGLLFTLWFMNMSGGLLTVCISHIINHDISWWCYPMYNIGGHIALLHAAVGVMEAFFHSFRIQAMERALECGTAEDREEYWRWVLKTMSFTHMMGMILLLRESHSSDIESGIGIGSRPDGEVSESSDAEAPQSSPCADEKAALNTGRVRGERNP